MNSYFNVSMKTKIIYATLGFLLLSGAMAFHYYQKIFSNAVSENTTIYVPHNLNLNELNTLITPYLKDSSDFLWLSSIKKFNTPKSGMYLLKKGMTLNHVVNMFRAGLQTPTKVSFNNQNTIEKLAGRIAEQIEVDSLTLLNTMLDDSFLKQHGFNKKSALGMYIPNQYEVYWNITPKAFRTKMLKAYNTFWNATRLNKAKQLNLSKQDVITLASIVQKETAQENERAMVAGLYLNRLQNGWPLQADPTVIYSLKEVYGHDKVYKRVLNKDLNIDSPYNTYKYIGLPPSLIAMPDISSIDGVLNPKKHDYFYMCASIDNMGYHDFAKTLAQHIKNAAKYQRWVNEQGIKR